MTTPAVRDPDPLGTQRPGMEPDSTPKARLAYRLQRLRAARDPGQRRLPPEGVDATRRGAGAEARLTHRLQHVRTVHNRQLLEPWWEEERRALARQTYARPAAPRPLAPGPAPLLVVSPEAKTCEDLTAVLVREGFTVTSAVDGEEALRVMAPPLPAVIFWEMPVTLVDNGGLIGALRARRMAVPVVLLTASASGGAWAKHLEARGALRLPLDPAALRTMVTEILVAQRGPASPGAGEAGGLTQTKRRPPGAAAGRVNR